MINVKNFKCLTGFAISHPKQINCHHSGQVSPPVRPQRRRQDGSSLRTGGRIRLPGAGVQRHQSTADARAGVEGDERLAAVALHCRQSPPQGRYHRQRQRQRALIIIINSSSCKKTSRPEHLSASKSGGNSADSAAGNRMQLSKSLILIDDIEGVLYEDYHGNSGNKQNKNDITKTRNTREKKTAELWRTLQAAIADARKPIIITCSL